MSELIFIGGDANIERSIRISRILLITMRYFAVADNRDFVLRNTCLFRVFCLYTLLRGHSARQRYWEWTSFSRPVRPTRPKAAMRQSKVRRLGRLGRVFEIRNRFYPPKKENRLQKTCPTRPTCPELLLFRARWAGWAGLHNSGNEFDDQLGAGWFSFLPNR